MALTATPVSQLENLQDLVDNLRVSNFEVRDDQDEEIKKYTYDKDIQEIIVSKDGHIE